MNENEDTPLCIDCKFYERRTGMFVTFRHACRLYINVVTGEDIINDCRRMRRSEEDCGQEGKEFKAKIVEKT